MTPDELRAAELADLDAALGNSWVLRFLTAEQVRRMRATRELIATDDAAVAKLAEIYNAMPE
jgi:hypothetical protein